jgi:hypothetical protein
VPDAPYDAEHDACPRKRRAPLEKKRKASALDLFNRPFQATSIEKRRGMPSKRNR